jgi:hypothetical protein
MPKQIFCANCGLELFFIVRVVKGNIYDVVQPHACERLNEPIIPNNEFVPLPKEKPSNRELDEMFDSFKFVQKLNDLSIKTGDNRPAEDLRKEKLITSSAPSSIIKSIKQEN